MKQQEIHEGPGCNGASSSLRTVLRRARLGLTLAALVVGTGIAAQAQTPPLASPAIDESLFKDGAVQARESKFDAWYTKCQEIVKIKRRICNLLSTVNDGDGKAQGTVLVATTDNGAPAMMIALTGPILEDRPIIVQASYGVDTQKKKRVPVTFKNSVKALRCDPSCKFMLSFDPKLVYALNEGKNVTVLAPIPTPDQAATKKRKKKHDVSTLAISGTGFAAALKASTEPW